MNECCFDSDLVRKQALLHKQREKGIQKYFDPAYDPAYFIKLEEAEKIRSILTKYMQDQLPDHLVKSS